MRCPFPVRSLASSAMEMAAAAFRALPIADTCTSLMATFPLSFKKHMPESPMMFKSWAGCCLYLLSCPKPVMEQ